jgi:hypothetical protein
MTQFFDSVVQIQEVMNSWNFYLFLRQKRFQDLFNGLLGMITNHPE